MLKGGGKVYSQMRLFLTLILVFSSVSMTWISHRGFNKTQWRRLNNGMGCILVQGNYGAASCAGASKRSWIHRHVGAITALHRRGSFVWRRVGIMLLGQWIYFRLITFVFCIIHLVHRTWTLSRTSGDGWQGTFMKMERSLRPWVLSAKLCSPPGQTFLTTLRLVTSMPQRIVEVTNKNGGGTH